ncbi:site-specific DNA-methyltransferase [Pseudogemmatithrix spongiicola]|uniref:site-specific DNA-methyltransferase n=1 Tax=Pseudogemmatithrix spongiicola TaxID=3062599 RepID=UPI0034655F92
MAKSPKSGTKLSAKATAKSVEAITHDEAKRKNIPTAEYSALHGKGDDTLRVAYERRNRDLDPQLVWRGKDEQDWSDLVVPAPPLYIQEKVHPKALIDDLLRQTRAQQHESGELMADLFADFNGIPKGVDKTEFYQHEQNWTNRMILGDSLQVMASLAEREGLRGKVQCIYFDPPYGIKFNSNFQWSTTSRDVKDGNAAHITREPEQVKAFRDTWRDGIHSYLTYLRDRLTVARDLLTESGSIFVQIGDENVHRVRTVMDEVFGDENLVAIITVQKAGSTFAEYLGGVADFVLWYARERTSLKYRSLYSDRGLTDEDRGRFSLFERADGTRFSASVVTSAPADGELVAPDPLQSASAGRDKGEGAASWFPVELEGKTFRPTMQSRWKTNEDGMGRLVRSNRVIAQKDSIRYARRFRDFPVQVLTNIWTDLAGATDKVYVVQTSTKIVERCLLLATDPGDLVLDPTCGSGTTAAVAEQWGRRWITIDTSRVALALARSRIMGARYAAYLLADSREGQLKEAEITRSVPSTQPVHGDLRLGFVYERVPHITLKSIANNAEIDVIYENWQQTLEPLRRDLNAALKQQWEEWEIPRDADAKWSEKAKALHTAWWEARINRQKEIDASIAAKAEYEYLYDRPYEDKKRVRVAGPFTVESLSPHRMIVADEDGASTPAATVLEKKTGYAAAGQSFPERILANLKVAGVQQAAKADRITFDSLVPWPGDFVCAEGMYQEGKKAKRAAIFIGPEFGTVTRPDLVGAAREAKEAGFEVLVACAFNFEAHTTEFEKLANMPVLKARMNADLHMAADLKTTDKANLFVVFGEPDIAIEPVEGDRLRVTVQGVDVFDPSTGEVRSDDVDGIACWFVDTDYNEESFFVRHAYFLGQNDPYKALKTTLKAEVDAEAWATLNSATSRAFPRPKSGRIAVKVINHLGDEVMKVFRV